MFTLENAIAGKIANTPVAELKSAGATKEILLQVGFAATDIDLVFSTTVVPTFGVSTKFLRDNGVKGTERTYIIPNFSLNEKQDAVLEWVIYALSAASKALYPNFKTVLKTENEILEAKADESILKYASVGCFKTSNGKIYRMGILNDVIDRDSNEYTLHCTKKADASSTVKTYDVVEILHR